jgi:hypothetical protein
MCRNFRCNEFFPSREKCASYRRTRPTTTNGEEDDIKLRFSFDFSDDGYKDYHSKQSEMS